MDIWMLNHYALPPFLPGGTRHFDLAKQLVDSGHRVTVFASSFQHLTFDEKGFTEGNDHKYVTYEGVDWCWIKTFPYQNNGWKRIVNMLSFYKKVLKVGKKAEKGRPDIIIGSTVHPFTPLAAIKLKKYFKVPYIYEVRDLWPQTMIDMGVWTKDAAIAKFFKKIEEKSIQNSSGVIALSPLTKEYVHKEYGNHHDVIYLPNSIDLTSFDQRKGDEKLKSQSHPTIEQLKHVRKHKFLLLFTGSVVLSNKMGFLIEAAKLMTEKGLDSVHIAIVGNGQERTKLEKEVVDQGLNNIKFYDPVPKDRVSHLLEIANALMLIQGDVMWGSMNKLFDYMASEKPIISAISASHNNPLMEIDQELCVQNFNANQLTEILERLVNVNPSHIKEVSQAFRSKVEKDHDIKGVSLRLEEFLKAKV
jgi:glycosyltransferase involved in cell wall biosynthesis